MELKRYTPDFKAEWDRLVNEGKNSSFLFKRDFMEYNADRFRDYSLMVYHDAALVAIVPATISGGQLVSHEGLTYGGVVIKDHLRLVEIISVVKEVLIYLDANQIKKMLIKFIPRMFHSRPCDELDWIMFKLGAKIYRRDAALVIENRAVKLNYQERRRRSIKKASKLKVDIKEGFEEFKPFWTEVLVPNLQAKHSVTPVHNLGEIELLACRFPENIKQHNIYLDNLAVAGCTMFLNERVAHAQYISGSPLGKKSGCLDYLFDYLIHEVYADYDYFDFGICNEQSGLLINKGLLAWKEGFGARTIVHDFYEIDTSQFTLLEI
ncbi:GNAT family N-acetyltransferase [Haliscomenobacter hydrossis]|uniref:Uncharacterized protein n=1 Tax=Haliscomenobacter hydrossis (strain ATCC 27775 / DSM 1100 / LMG 10767 / O) TaxID=760192 RepID=F4KX18_HALH1|nr:GNAT family N-acetyltransferase [Haliscomenobacter hydrossis]AEE53618.1 hypothetical protein Halhy_5795 [Haliscomenobacter hydrossis DSM 1100]